MRVLLATSLVSMILMVPALAGSVVMAPVTLTEWKAVYGQVEARDLIPARARIGGTLVTLTVTEGDLVKAGQRIALVQDDKIAFQVSAVDARLRALKSQLDNAEAELRRGQTLVDKGVSTTQKLDQLRTQSDVFRNQIEAAEAERQVVVQQGAEGEILSPTDGRVLTVPVTKGAVLMPGEVVATIGGGGFFLRLAIPERHATTLTQGASLQIETGKGPVEGRLARIYPQIENGRVIADVEVGDLNTAFVNARLLVRVPVGEREALVLPASGVTHRSGLDFVKVRADGGEKDRTVVLGAEEKRDGVVSVEILSGLVAGDEVILP